MHQAWQSGVGKFVALERSAPIRNSPRCLFHEDDLWNGYPEETNAPYGLAKEDAAGPGASLSPAIRI